ncbi:ABC transporter ATP-binding protein [Plantactinospora endophytica]|uniref:ABC transporter ATP-binding protein n=1 Tax=Plantactinospora endophytica TaxID=673535 RepID=A0ABQ4E956_9ACTN|nr:ABC transporter ATP-binding protein [Plantactinospora endophytica]GIG91248.1 ABC transporter ATP-binding protein [Plantactinospora endophytica]
MLRIRGLSAGYDGGTVLHDVDLDVPAGSVQALVGRNGAGKSTLVHAVAGLLRPYRGIVAVDGADLAGRPAHRVARAGVGLVPQGRRVFPRLSVAEHLTLAASLRRRGASRSGPNWTVPGVLELLPRLAERLDHRGNQLSGGEQQMLAIARALLTQPRVLLLDEPGEGLAPDLAARVRDLVTRLAGAGLCILLVEQQLQHAIEVADRIAVLDYGRLVFADSTAAVRADPAPVEAVLSVAGAATPDGTGPIPPGQEPTARTGPDSARPGPTGGPDGLVLNSDSSVHPTSSATTTSPSSSAP